MLEVGCPEPALVLARIESTRNCRASCATVARSEVVSGGLAAVMLRGNRARGGVQQAATLNRSAFETSAYVVSADRPGAWRAIAPFWALVLSAALVHRLGRG